MGHRGIYSCQLYSRSYIILICIYYIYLWNLYNKCFYDLSYQYKEERFCGYPHLILPHVDVTSPHLWSAVWWWCLYCCDITGIDFIQNK